MTQKIHKVRYVNLHSNHGFMQGSQNAAAFDLYFYDFFEPTAETLAQWKKDKTKLVIPPNSTVMVDTGIRLNMNQSTQLCALVLPRSGAGSKGLILGNTIGLIDNDYIGALRLSLYNRTDKPIIYPVAKAIAQCMFLEVPVVELERCDDVSQFSKTKRGANGFGSTDKV